MEVRIHQNPIVIWVCLKIVYPIVPNGFADHYPYEKWLFHWEYTQHFQTNPYPCAPCYDHPSCNPQVPVVTARWPWVSTLSVLLSEWGLNEPCRCLGCWKITMSRWVLCWKKISYKRIICSMAMLVYQTVSLSSLCLFRLFLHLLWAQFFQRFPLGIPTVNPLDKPKTDMVGYICHSILIKWTVSPPGNIEKENSALGFVYIYYVYIYIYVCVLREIMGSRGLSVLKRTDPQSWVISPTNSCLNAHCWVNHFNI